MIVLTYGGTRLIDTTELRIIPWYYDSSKKYVPVESYLNIPPIKYRWAVSTVAIHKPNTIQVSRLFKTFEEADETFKAFARSLSTTFFYDDSNKQKEAEECDAKPKALSCRTIPIEPEADKNMDAVVTLEG